MGAITREQLAGGGSAALYRTLFDGSPQAVLLVDEASMRILRANPAAAREYGYRAEELIDLPLAKLWPNAAEAFARRRRAQDSERTSWRHVHRSGESIDMLVTFQDVSFDDRESIALHLSNDTDRVLSAALMQAQGRLLEMVARGDALQSVLDELVRSMERLSGGMLGSVLLVDVDGRHVRHGAAPSLPQQYWRAIDGLAIGPAAGSCGTAMHTGRAVIVEDIEHDPLWKDYRALALPHGLRACWSTPIRSRSGKVLGAFAMYYRQTGAPGERDRRLVALASDLAAIAIERESAERALQASEARLRAIIDHAFTAVSLKDLEGRYVLVNRRCEEITGIAASRALGRTDRQLFARPLAEIYSANDRKVVEARKAIEFEEEFSQPDGAHVQLAVKFPLLHPDGSAYGICAILCDITERKRAERALEQSKEELRALTAKLQDVREEERARISREIHDQLGQMLTALDMSHSLLARSVRERMPAEEWIGAELESMHGVLAKLLASVRRIAAELRPEALDTLGLAAAVEWQAAEFTRRTGVLCHTVFPDGPVQADLERSTALFRILQEALTNVARHAAATEVQIEMRQDESSLEMSIVDNGRGVPGTAEPGAASLGLLGMRERAAAFGGTLTIGGMRGGGTRVTVRMPAMDKP
jgi:PAS domain S-box-containing protein